MLRPGALPVLDRALAAAPGAAAAAVERLFDLWTAEPFGLAGARREVERHGAELLDGRGGHLPERAAAARLSCADQRFAELARAVGVEAGPLGDGERERLRVEINARVARAWSLTATDLDVLLADFTLDAVPPGYRRRLATRLAELPPPR